MAARVPPPSAPPIPPPLRWPSWAVMAQEDELAAAAADDDGDEEKEADGAGRPRVRLTREQRELHRFLNVLWKDDFICFERIKGHLVNILPGLELHAGMFSTAEQKHIVDCVYGLQEMRKRGELGAS